MCVYVCVCVRAVLPAVCVRELGPCEHAAAARRGVDPAQPTGRRSARGEPPAGAAAALQPRLQQRRTDTHPAAEHETGTHTHTHTHTVTAEFNGAEYTQVNIYEGAPRTHLNAATVKIHCYRGHRTSAGGK